MSKLLQLRWKERKVGASMAYGDQHVSMRMNAPFALYAPKYSMGTILRKLIIISLHKLHTAKAEPTKSVD